MQKDINITKEGRAELEKELAELIAQRPEITERIATARSFGDLSENEDYSAARNDQKVAETRIEEIQEILKHAKLIRSNASRGKVTMGSVVKVSISGKKQEFTIVGPVEANPLEGKISNESPIGQAIFGLKVGDAAKLPNGKNVKITEIK